MAKVFLNASEPKSRARHCLDFIRRLDLMAKAELAASLISDYPACCAAYYHPWSGSVNQPCMWNTLKFPFQKSIIQSST